MHIFGNLRITDLYNVAICSRRFQAVAVRTFDIELRGHFELYKGHNNIREIMRIFGAFIKRFEFQPDLNLNPSFIWPYLNASKLEIMKINPRVLHFNDIQARFDKVTDIKLEMYDHPYFPLDANFNACFPNLKQLLLSGTMDIKCSANHIPRALHTLEIKVHPLGSIPLDEALRSFLSVNFELLNLKIGRRSYVGNPNTCIDIMVECHTHKTLQSLCIQAEEFPTTPKLQRFEELKRLEVTCDSMDGILQFLPLTTHLPKLDHLAIKSIDMETRDYYEPVDWMMIPTITPPSLKTFNFVGFDPPGQWEAFAAAMPQSCECSFTNIVGST